MMVPFAESNPQIKFAVSMKTNAHPFVKGWYVRDKPKQLNLANLSPEQVAERVQFLRDARPIGLKKSSKPFTYRPYFALTLFRVGWLVGEELVAKFGLVFVINPKLSYSRFPCCSMFCSFWLFLTKKNVWHDGCSI